MGPITYVQYHQAERLWTMGHGLFRWLNDFSCCWVVLIIALRSIDESEILESVNMYIWIFYLDQWHSFVTGYRLRGFVNLLKSRILPCSFTCIILRALFILTKYLLYYPFCLCSLFGSYNWSTSCRRVHAEKIVEMRAEKCLMVVWIKVSKFCIHPYLALLFGDGV